MTRTDDGQPAQKTFHDAVTPWRISDEADATDASSGSVCHPRSR
jgi:hypothetical protein